MSQGGSTATTARARPVGEVINLVDDDDVQIVPRNTNAAGPGRSRLASPQQGRRRFRPLPQNNRAAVAIDLTDDVEDVSLNSRARRLASAQGAGPSSAAPRFHGAAAVPAPSLNGRRRSLAPGDAPVGLDSGKRRRGSAALPGLSWEEQAAPPVEQDDKGPKCAVCLDSFTQPSCGPCGHVFCRACLLATIKATKKCPTCRKAIQPRHVHRIYLS